MLIGNNATPMLFISDQKAQSSKLQSSMARLASGKRNILPGEAPADLGIAELFKAQQRNSKEASNVIQNAINLFTTSDGWLGKVHDILGRMSELSISAYDGSKNQNDRENLDLEFQQLKSEIARIAGAGGKFNGKSINSNIAPATYNSKDNTITYSQIDGTEATNLNINVAPGNSSSNGIDYEFVDEATEAVGSFLFSHSGKELAYITQPALSQSQGAAAITSAAIDLTTTNNWSTADDITIAGDNVTLTNVAALGTSIATNTQASLNTLVAAFQADIEAVETLKNNYKITGTLNAGDVTLTITTGDTGTDAFVSTVDGSTSNAGIGLLGFTTATVAGGNVSFIVADNLATGDEVIVNTNNNGTITANKLTAGSDFAVGANETATATNLTAAITALTGITATASGTTITLTETAAASGTFNTVAGMSASINKLNVEEDIITSVKLSSPKGGFPSKLKMDEEGGVWALNPATMGGFNLARLDIRNLTLDEGGPNDSNTWSGGITINEQFSDFAVHGESIYYVNNDFEYVRRGFYDTTTEEVIIANVIDDAEFNPYFNGSNVWTVSQDGYYIAWRDFDETTSVNELKVLNTDSLKISSQQVGSLKENISAIDFDGNNNVYWTDTGSTSAKNGLYKAKVAPTEVPTINTVTLIRNGNLGEFGGDTLASVANGNGLSVQGGSPGTIYDFLVGPDENMVIQTVTGNVDLISLGLSRLDVKSALTARDSIAAIAEAISKVSKQRAVVGSQVSRLGFTYDANIIAMNNIAQAESRISDVDFAFETARMSQAKVAEQAATKVLSMSNSQKQNILSLLQGL
jgi:flagellin-like hook-associated protein FlgL